MQDLASEETSEGEVTGQGPQQETGGQVKESLVQRSTRSSKNNEKNDQGIKSKSMIQGPDDVMKSLHEMAGGYQDLRENGQMWKYG